jgi:hypothetical protein
MAKHHVTLSTSNITTANIRRSQSAVTSLLYHKYMDNVSMA